MMEIFSIKNSFEEKFINKVKNNFLEFINSQESSFYKMKENCPDFHRVIDENVSNLYSIKALKHLHIFFHGMRINIIYLNRFMKRRF